MFFIMLLYYSDWLAETTDLTLAQLGDTTNGCMSTGVRFICLLHYSSQRSVMHFLSAPFLVR